MRYMCELQINCLDPILHLDHILRMQITMSGDETLANHCLWSKEIFFQPQATLFWIHVLEPGLTTCEPPDVRAVRDTIQPMSSHLCLRKLIGKAINKPLAPTVEPVGRDFVDLC